MKVEQYYSETLFTAYPFFEDDVHFLFQTGIIEYSEFYDKENDSISFAKPMYNWTKSKTSLAEYFDWIGKESHCVPGGFWTPISIHFLVQGKPIKKYSLSRLASRNANDAKPEESRDFVEIKKLVSQFRKEHHERLKIFRKIKKIMTKTHNERSDIIESAIREISNILCGQKK